MKGTKTPLHATVAVVAAYGYSSLEEDLAIFRHEYGLDPCTISNGCLAIMGQDGGAPPVGDNEAWDLQQALGVDMASATCPQCQITVVQSNSNLMTDLEAAVNTAVDPPSPREPARGVAAGFAAAPDYDHPAYDHPGFAIVAPSGDIGYQSGAYPASDSHVIAVGGTSIVRDDSERGYSETAWFASGSGCGLNKRPAWQKKVGTTCRTKANSDLAGPADPVNGGLSVYDSQVGGWTQVGGTAEAAAFIAPIYAHAINSKGTGANNGRMVAKAYKKPGYLFDITEGSNGDCSTVLCDAGAGWDGPTGLGTPNGLKSFMQSGR